jgi:hypothetical protein
MFVASYSVSRLDENETVRLETRDCLARKLKGQLYKRMQKSYNGGHIMKVKSSWKLTSHPSDGT